MIFLGWDMRQWSAAKEYYDRLNPDDAAPATLAGAAKVRHFWKTRRLDAPDRSELIVPEHCNPAPCSDWFSTLLSSVSWMCGGTKK